LNLKRFFKKNEIKKILLKSINLPSKPSNIRLSRYERVVSELTKFESIAHCKQFKFGILYAHSNQTTEEEMFSNKFGSDNFDEFLSFLGDFVELQGWQNYAGGLDVNKNTTGTHSVYTNWNNNEIMFHVSTMLPYSEYEPQQLERKRHLGNDIGILIFVDGDNTNYNTDTISSQFIHFIGIIQPIKNQETKESLYRVQFTHKNGVPDFGPHIQFNPNQKNSEFRDILLQKLINGQISSYQSPEISGTLYRSYYDILNGIVTCK